MNKNYISEEYSYGILKEKELEVLGLNLQYDFFKQFSGLYEKYHMVKIAKLQVNRKSTTIGIIKKIKEIKTKQQESMAFMEIEDDISTIEVVVFPRTYQSSLPLTKDMIIMVTGNLQKREKMQLVADVIKKI